MRNFLLGLLAAIVLLGLAATWIWHHQPEHLPREWRRANPNSQDYMPEVYRWRDAQGRVQITDTPPVDRPYETVRIDPNRNLIPAGTPPSGPRP